jgi:hemerythrin-like domain-containing protein
MAVAQRSKIDFTIMYSTHDAFRRDLGRLEEAVTAERTDSDKVRAGWKNFKNQLHVHHSVEDAALWPRVERAVAGRPADLALMKGMRAEHALLEAPLNAIDEAMAAKSGVLVEQVQELSSILSLHMAHEENSALPLIQEVLTVKEWGAFRNAMARAQGPKGAAMYVPWIMDGADAEDQRAFLNAMPSPLAVINRLFWQSRYQKKRLWGNGPSSSGSRAGVGPGRSGRDDS